MHIEEILFSKEFQKENYPAAYFDEIRQGIKCYFVDTNVVLGAA